MDIKRHLIIKACYLYYEKELPQNKIAQQMGISPMSVSRLLKKAKESGIVKIRIASEGLYTDLEEYIKDSYSLKDVIIAQSEINEDSKKDVASFAAYYLDTHVDDSSTVAVGWGSTLYEIARQVSPRQLPRSSFIAMIGGQYNSPAEAHASNIASILGQKYGGTSYPLLFPAFSIDPKEKQIINQNVAFNETLYRASKADLAVFSVNNPQLPNNSLECSGYIDKDNLRRVHSEDAVCEIVSSVFIDSHGKECCIELSKAVNALDGERIKSIPNKICVASGVNKALPVKTAVMAGYVDTLIIDKTIADHLV